jgi:hypothetical protein
MELATRRVHFAGSTANPDEPWMLQVARNACDAEYGFPREKKYLLMDRDTKFSGAFRIILEESGVAAVRLPPRSPNLSPNLERFMRSIKEECLERIIFFGEKSLQNAVADFLAHYHQERNHQGLNNQLIQPGNEVGCITGDVACRERLGGMLRYYYRQQAAWPYYPEMAQDSASLHEVRPGNGSPLFYQSEDARIVLGRRKTKPHAIAVHWNSASLPIPILGDRRICWTSEYLDLTGLQTEEFPQDTAGYSFTLIWHAFGEILCKEEISGKWHAYFCSSNKELGFSDNRTMVPAADGFCFGAVSAAPPLVVYPDLRTGCCH